MTPAERKRLIAGRQQRSPFWWIIHRMGSLKLALVLLASIGTACAVATFYESTFNAQVAQAYIYKAPWFVLWLGILCLNLAGAALTRWPWEKKHTGFLVTHAGIIILLIGAMIGMKSGFEAGVTLKTGDRPTNRLVRNETIVQFDSPRDGAIYITPLPVEVGGPRPDRSRILAIPDSLLRLVVDEYHPGLVERPVLVAASPGTGDSGVQLTFASNMMGQEIPVQLFSEGGADVHHDFFGLAHIEFLPELPAPDAIEKARGIPIFETHVVFEQERPVVHSEGERPSGAAARLRRDGTEWIVDIATSDGDIQTRKLDEIIRAPFQQAGLDFMIHNFWPDFAMVEGEPASRSDEPNNPAILMQVAGLIEPEVLPVLQLAAEGPGAVRYRVLREGNIALEGRAAEGETIVPGWADWAATVTAALPHAALRPVIEPPKDDSEEGIPGIRARLRGPDNAEGEPVWIPSGRSQELFLGKEFVRIGFGLRTHRVPFYVELLGFEVPRDEGTTQPSDWISRIRFESFETGESVERTSRMNHPASYPGGLWNVLSGFNYKFSQASWNPDDLTETTLQVLYDPGWSLKWIGSLLLCAGMTILFYMKPYSRNRRPSNDSAGTIATPAQPADERTGVGGAR